MKVKAVLVIGRRCSRYLLPALIIGLSVLTMALSWQESAPLSGELFSALTVCSLLMLLRLLSPDSRTNEN